MTAHTDPAHTDPVHTDPVLPVLRTALHEELPHARQLRRQLHARPQRSGDESQTRDLVLAELPGGQNADLVADTGAVVRIGAAGAAVAIRAELDALPVREQTGVTWAADNGLMHACGHDVHMAALVAIARAVHRVRPATPLVAVLQPREETYPAGAKDVVSSGILDAHDVVAMLGAHVQPTLPERSVACTPGAVNAAADEFVVTMHGAGGHAAYPHLNRDAVLAVAQCVVSLQQLVSRDSDPMTPAVVTVSSIKAGEAPNITPSTAVARGVLRSLSMVHRSYMHDRLRAVATGIAQVHGCSATVEITNGEPVLRNDPALTDSTSSYLRDLGYQVSDGYRSCGADDFAYFAERFASLMLFVGVGDGSGPPLHHPEFLPDDGAVDRVADAMLAGYLAAAGAADRSAKTTAERR
ncbi:M20 metallopeptidase family protein [Phytoactinopolyspora endophytica]|uniref:M20 metallopeptidase family protein n=1 Tax=Phytoactinopolyspora endophytica TaxID=1642495 RepID=UPI00101C689F|nr:M20 family metallopeptidase [Phytoactinopolyspora endophytica]